MSDNSNLVDAVAQIAEKVEWDSLPESVKRATERGALQVLATTDLGANREIARHAVNYAIRYSPGDCLIIGRKEKATPESAAFANATMCHADFRDDAHAPSQSHPGVTVIPAALAAAQVAGIDAASSRFGAAVVAGYQVIGRMGRLGANYSTPRGFRASAIYSVFGGAVAAALVLGLKGQQLRHAISLAAQTAAGLNQPYYDGTDEWMLLPGTAAKSGVMVALLARDGLAGAPRNLDGELGFYRAYADLKELGDINDPAFPDWEVEVTRLKTVLTCGWNQAPINTLLGSGVALEDIDRLELRQSREAYEFAGVINYGPFESFTAAALSLPFAVGAIFSTGMLNAGTYDNRNSSDILEHAKRIKAMPDDRFHGYDMELTIIKKDGSREVLLTPGDMPKWLLTWEDVKGSLSEKFRQAGLGQERLEAMAATIPDALAGRGLAPLLQAIGA
ncbi:MmgE/PrpD family protein [Achromobacter aloeverae]